MEAARFLAVAVAGLILDLAVAWSAARYLGLPLWLAAALGFAVAAAMNYALHEALRLYEAGGNPGEEANLAKLLSADASWAAAEACLQTHGGFGFAEEYDVERKFRETRLYRIAPVSNNLVLSFIGEHVLGMPKSY